MRVIKKGKPTELQTMCNHCNSIIGYNQNEILNNCTNADLHLMCKYIRCPVCGEEIRLNYFIVKDNIMIERTVNK